MILLKLYVYLISKTCFADVNLLVEVEQGKLCGKTSLDRNNEVYYSFLSIPYAKPPIGKLRFRAPEVPEPWIGVRDATKDLPRCPQTSILSNDGNQGQEDCLFLNIHTPEVHIKQNKSLKPVRVFIHGGSYVEGSGTISMYGADFIMGHGVVLVTINYRLGIFGFISSTDDRLGVYGNAGLKDQVLAFQWLKKNIRKFGGDPDNVTIFGQSAGGGSVHHHILSPMSKGLFHKVIAMSGTALGAWNNGVKGSLEIQAKLLNISTDNKVKMLEKMQDLSIQAILKTEIKNPLFIPINIPFMYSPVIETNHANAFLTAKPLDIIKSRDYQHVPMMLGYTNIDGILFEIIPRLLTGKPLLFEDLTLAVPNDLKLTPTESQLLRNEIKNYYFGGEIPSEKNLRNFTNLATDLWFATSIDRTIMEHLKSGDKLFLYRFSADTELNYCKKLDLHASKVPGAAHCDDLGYLMNSIYTPKIIQKNSVEDIGIKSMVSLYTNFAKYGTPINQGRKVEWLPVTKDKLNYLEIGTNTLTSGVSPDKERVKFWREVYNKYGNTNKN